MGRMGVKAKLLPATECEDRCGKHYETGVGELAVVLGIRHPFLISNLELTTSIGYQ